MKLCHPDRSDSGAEGSLRFTGHEAIPRFVACLPARQVELLTRDDRGENKNSDTRSEFLRSLRSENYLFMLTLTREPNTKLEMAKAATMITRPMTALRIIVRAWPERSVSPPEVIQRKPA